MQTPAPASSSWTSTAYTVGAVVLIVVALVVYIILWRGRKRPGDHVFRASRLSKGNRVFPSQVMITASSITHFRPQMIGKIEKSIHMAHVASIRIDTNIVFSDVYIETTGGHNPIACYGHFKSEALEMKRIIEKYQSDYYKKQKQSGDRPIG
jgi:heme/copper-type cytochrome/quinol oxidase subunit 2